MKFAFKSFWLNVRAKKGEILLNEFNGPLFSEIKEY